MVAITSGVKRVASKNDRSRTYEPIGAAGREKWRVAVQAELAMIKFPAGGASRDMRGEQLELEGIAEAAYAEAKLDAERPGVVRLARALLGPDAVQRGPRPVASPAALFRVGDAWRILIARSLPRAYALFAVGHELGHWLLRRHGVQVDDEERAADYLGGALLAPRRAFIAARRAVGDDLAELAEAFSTTETGAALRLGEVIEQPLAVVAPQRVRVRGPESWVWPDESTLRRWARRPAPGLRKVRLTDDPRRVVLDAEQIDAS
jgi:hypothetical protein